MKIHLTSKEKDIHLTTQNFGDRLVLQRVGDRYRFIHRLIQERFAAMPLDG